MDNKETSWGWLILIFLFFIAFTGNGIFGRGERGVAAQPFAPYMPYFDGCNRVSNCEVEKQTLINTATTQNLINQQGEATRMQMRDDKDAIMAQASRIFEADQAEKLFDAKLKIQALESQAVATANYNALALQNERCCCETNRRLDQIECQMLKKPHLFGVASTCSGQYVPSVPTS